MPKKTIRERLDFLIESVQGLVGKMEECLVPSPAEMSIYDRIAYRETQEKKAKELFPFGVGYLKQALKYARGEE